MHVTFRYPKKRQNLRFLGKFICYTQYYYLQMKALVMGYIKKKKLLKYVKK